MEEIVRRRVCERHPTEDSKIEGFMFHYPPTGRTYLIEPCGSCWDAIEDALGPFIDRRPPLPKRTALKPNDPPKVVQLPAVSVAGLSNYEWAVPSDRPLQSNAKAHVVYVDTDKSRCGFITECETWTEAASGMTRCGICEIALAKDIRNAKKQDVGDE